MKTTEKGMKSLMDRMGKLEEVAKCADRIHNDSGDLRDEFTDDYRGHCIYCGEWEKEHRPHCVIGELQQSLKELNP
jgi:hypothetical protein